MLLSFENIAYYLLEKGLISLDSIISGDFTARDQSSRNTNFAINQEHSPSYLVKQVRAHDQEKKETLRIEATCYWLANNDDAYTALKGFLSRYYEYDYLHHILVLEFLPNVENLHEFYYRKVHFPAVIAEKIADLLISYHTYEEGVVEKQKSYSLFKKRLPWVFTLSENSLTDWLNVPTMGAAEKQSVKLILENRAFLDHTKEIGKEWERKSLIHGDVKFPNFLIHKNYLEGQEPDIRLIDWELADIGDPLWDVAAVIQNYLTLWVGSEIQQEYNPDPSAVVDLEQIQSCISAFWKRYATRKEWTNEEQNIYLEKTLRYAALKLVHTCFESVQGVNDMSMYSAKMLQLSLNMLNQPKDAIRDLLGIHTNANNYAAFKIAI